MATTDDVRLPTRRRLLEAGFRMWVDEPPHVLFGGFTVSRVAKAAGVTRATFYSYWPSTADYLQDLLAHLEDHTPIAYDQEVATVAGQVGTAGSDVVTQLLAACDREFEIIRDDPALRVRLAFLSQMDDPEVAEVLSQRLRETESMKGDRYGVVIEGWGREARPPVDDSSLQAIFQMLGDAMVARHLIDPEGMPEELYGLVVNAMMMVLTRRIDDPRDLPQLIDQINTWPAIGLRLRGQQRSGRALGRPAMDLRTAGEAVRAARRLLATMGWQEVALSEIAAIAGLTEDMLLRGFGSKSGLAMAIFNLDLNERFAELTLDGDPITDLRTVIGTIGHALRRVPALTQSVVLLMAGVAAMPTPEIITAQSPMPMLIDMVAAAQGAGQLRHDLDPTAFTESLIRVLLTENAWPGPGPGLDVDLPELILAGAGAPPPTN